MNYLIEKNKIKILCTEFNPKDIFECGQVFSYKKIEQFYFVYPGENLAAIYFENENYYVECLKGTPEFFVNYFDLGNNYSNIIKKIKKLNKNEFNLQLIDEAIEFGKGIRILKQEFVETLISFIFSANNNIKRFTNSLNLLRKNYGEKINVKNKSKNNRINLILEKNEFYSFPNLETLKNLTEEYFVSIGAGYRANYLVDTISRISNNSFEDFNKLPTEALLLEIEKFKGVGRKVGECVLLFAFSRLDVFPVDTWINKVYFDLFGENEKTNRKQISKFLVEKFGLLSGYVQQYLFYYKRELWKNFWLFWTKIILGVDKVENLWYHNYGSNPQ